MRTQFIGIMLVLGLGAAVYAAQAPQTNAPEATAPPAGGAGLQLTIGRRGGGGRRGAAGRGPGGFAGRGLTFPQFTRQLASPAVLAEGKTAYSSNCASCHAADLRGTSRGVNLLEGQVDLLDQHGELIAPIAAGGETPEGPHPASSLSTKQLDAVAEYIHAVQAQMEAQGRPPNAFTTPPGLDKEVLVGNPTDGAAYFQAHCSTCHSATGDLAGIGAKYPDPRILQNVWVAGSAASGGGRGGFFGRGGGASGTVSVTLKNGQTYHGQLLQENEFLVSLREPNGATLSFDRNYNVTSVVVNNPANAHKKMAMSLTDAAMHNITAYLATLK